MKTKILLTFLAASLLVAIAVAQDAAPGFIITLKNGSSLRGRTLTRDEASGKLRLTMTESGGGLPRSYAMISMEDTDSIRASSSDADSIRIRLIGGSELKCKEFGLSGDTVTVKIGSASRIEVRWEEIESISFAP